MKQIEIFEIPSPCIGVCEAGESGFCKGCFRSRDERLHWIKLEDDVKRKIVKACARRRSLAKRKKSAKTKDVIEEQQISLWDD